MSVYLNPQYYSGPVPELVKLSAKDGQTWQAGQPVRTTDSGIVLCKSNATSVTGLTAETQAVATSSSDVWINRINSASTKFVFGVTTGGSDTKAGQVLIGSNDGLAVNSCVATVSTGNDSNEIIRIDDQHRKFKFVPSEVEDTPTEPEFMPDAIRASQKRIEDKLDKAIEEWANSHKLIQTLALMLKPEDANAIKRMIDVGQLPLGGMT